MYVKNIVSIFAPQMLGSFPGIVFFFNAFFFDANLEKSYIEYSKFIPLTIATSFIFISDKNVYIHRFYLMILSTLMSYCFSTYYVGFDLSWRVMPLVLSIQCVYSFLYQGNSRFLFVSSIITGVAFLEAILTKTLYPYSFLILVIFWGYDYLRNFQKADGKQVINDMIVLLSTLGVSFGYGQYVMVDKLILSGTGFLQYFILISIVSAVFLNSLFLKAIKRTKGNDLILLFLVLIADIFLFLLPNKEFVLLIFLGFIYMIFQLHDFYLLKNHAVLRNMFWLMSGVFLFILPTIQSKFIVLNFLVVGSIFILRSNEKTFYR